MSHSHMSLNTCRTSAMQPHCQRHPVAEAAAFPSRQAALLQLIRSVKETVEADRDKVDAMFEEIQSHCNHLLNDAEAHGQVRTQCTADKSAPVQTHDIKPPPAIHRRRAAAAAAPPPSSGFLSVSCARLYQRASIRQRERECVNEEKEPVGECGEAVQAVRCKSHRRRYSGTPLPAPPALTAMPASQPHSPIRNPWCSDEEAQKAAVRTPPKSRHAREGKSKRAQEPGDMSAPRTQQSWPTAPNSARLQHPSSPAAFPSSPIAQPLSASTPAQASADVVPVAVVPVASGVASAPTVAPLPAVDLSSFPAVQRALNSRTARELGLNPAVHDSKQPLSPCHSSQTNAFPALSRALALRQARIRVEQERNLAQPPTPPHPPTKQQHSPHTSPHRALSSLPSFPPKLAPGSEPKRSERTTGNIAPAAPVNEEQRSVALQLRQQALQLICKQVQNKVARSMVSYTGLSCYHL